MTGAEPGLPDLPDDWSARSPAEDPAVPAGAVVCSVLPAHARGIEGLYVDDIGVEVTDYVTRVVVR